MSRILLALCILLSLYVLSACDDAGGKGTSDATTSGDTGYHGDTAPFVPDPTEFTYRLEESSGDWVLWTTPATHKVVANEHAPVETRSGLHLSAARNEFEVVQLVVEKAGGGSLHASMAPFANLGASTRVQLAEAVRQEGWPEALDPLAEGDAIAVSDGVGSILWVTLYVPEGAPAGLHTTTLALDADGTRIEVPVELTVFDFTLPREVSFATQLNIDIASRIPAGGSEEDVKTLLLDHRVTPKSVTWPSGFNPSITWENSASSAPCETLWDEPNEGAPYSIGALAPKYMLGQGWDRDGFPNAMIFQFIDNSTPRPATFCGLERGDHYGSAAYNAEWSQFLSALEAYLRDKGLLSKAYYYVQNEPQDAEDHRLAAHLCRLTKAAAPGLRIAISEEPKPEIAEDAGGACGYDIWIAHVRAFQPGYAETRQVEHGEALWFYSLDQDPDPYFNPTAVDRQGLHMRIIPWVSWTYRARGWAYYDANRFFNGSEPTIRLALLREGLEDYEYLKLANGGEPPMPGSENSVDASVASVASSLTSWTKDADALMGLRHELGLFIEGSRDTLPTLVSDQAKRPKAAYYLNFQDPNGAPTDDPLVVDGQTYLKIGWQTYDEEQGLGWSGEFVSDPAIARYGFDDVAGYSAVQQSYVYDDYGRDNLFEFSLENGTYTVSYGVGRPQRGYPGDPHHLTVEGHRVVDDQPTSDAAPLIEGSVVVELADGSLSLEVGGKSASTGEWSYTFLSYVTIVPVE